MGSIDVMPAADLVADRGDGRPGRVPGHRAGVAEAEVDVVVPVDVPEVRTGGLGDEHRERRRAT